MRNLKTLAPGVHVLHIAYNLVISVAHFSNVPNVFGLSQCSVLSHVAFSSVETILKYQLFKTSGRQSYKWILGPEKSSGLAINGPQGRIAKHAYSYLTIFHDRALDEMVNGQRQNCL